MILENEQDASRWSIAIEQNLLNQTEIPTDTEIDENKVQSTFQLHIPVIDIYFRADQKELRPDLGLFDPYDVGIFSFEDAQIDKLHLVLHLQKLSIKQKSQQFRSATSIRLESISLSEEDYEGRFTSLLKTGEGLLIKLKSIDRQSKLYQNKDMDVELNIGILEANWKPRTLVRFFRFVRYNKYKTVAYS